MSKELALMPKDLTDVGISTQVTSNDLLEVVAHDIYNKYMNSIDEVNKKAGQLQKKYKTLLDGELIKMRRSLKDHFSSNEVLAVTGGEDLEDEYFEQDDDESDENINEPK